MTSLSRTTAEKGKREELWRIPLLRYNLLSAPQNPSDHACNVPGCIYLTIQPPNKRMSRYKVEQTNLKIAMPATNTKKCLSTNPIPCMPRLTKND